MIDHLFSIKRSLLALAVGELIVVALSLLVLLEIEQVLQVPALVYLVMTVPVCMRYVLAEVAGHFLRRLADSKEEERSIAKLSVAMCLIDATVVAMIVVAGLTDMAGANWSSGVAAAAVAIAVLAFASLGLMLLTKRDSLKKEHNQTDEVSVS